MARTPTKNGAKTAAARDDAGRFVGGAPGPGRPRGSRNKATMAAETLLAGEAAALTRKAIERALAGDPGALKLCLDRIAPPSRERRVAFPMPPIQGPEDLPAALGAIAEALAKGELSPGEAAACAAICERVRAAFETVALEHRVRALEADRQRGHG